MLRHADGVWATVFILRETVGWLSLLVHVPLRWNYLAERKLSARTTMRVTLLVYTSLLQQPRDSTLSKRRAGDKWVGNSFLGRHIYSNHVLYVPTVPRLCRANGSPQDSAPDGLSVVRAVYAILDGRPTVAWSVKTG
jgi:hypothetical protein